MSEALELQRLLGHLRRAHRLAAVGSWEAEVGKDVRIRWSPEAAAIAGWPEGTQPTYEALVGMIHPDDRPLFLEMRASALAGERPYAIDMRIQRTDGELRRVHLAADVVRDRDGRPVRVVGAVQDRTEELDGLRRLRITEVARRDLLQRVLDAADIERARLARHLASGPIERLVDIERRFVEDIPDEPSQVWVDGLTSVRKAIESLARTLTDIQAEPSTVGLAQIVEELAADSAPDVEVHVDVAPDVALRPPVEATLLRVVQEALHNVRKHADAARAEVRWHLHDGWVHVAVTDDGRGFDVDTVRSLAGHLGLVSMRERLEALGGHVDIHSRPGRTTVEARMPLA